MDPGMFRRLPRDGFKNSFALLENGSSELYKPLAYQHNIHTSLRPVILERATMSGRFFFSLLAFTASTVAYTGDSPTSLFGRGSNLSSRGVLPIEEPAIRVLTKRAPCKPGQYYTTRCRACTTGYSCPDGQNRVQCGAGAYSGPSATECTLCPYGTFSGSEYYQYDFFAIRRLTGLADFRTNHKIRDRLHDGRARPPRECSHRRHGPTHLWERNVLKWCHRHVHDVSCGVQMLLVGDLRARAVRTWDVLQRR